MKTLLTILLLAAARAGAVQLTVVHTNDIHGWVLPRSAVWHKENPQRQIGGAAVFTAYYQSIPGPKLLLDAGDWFYGTPEGTATKGQIVLDVFNAIPYDAVVVGNHDFDFKESRLKELVSQMKPTVLGANIRDEKTGARVPYLKPWIVKEVSGVKVGLFGLTTSKTPFLTFPDNVAGLKFGEEIAEAREAVAELKKLGATVIILVDHVGVRMPEMGPFTSDQVIAAQVPGIDLIVGGHMHIFLHQPFRDANNGTLITEAGSYLSAAGKVTLDVDDKTGRVVSSSGALVDLWLDKWGEDEKIKRIVAGHADKVRAVYDVPIATAAAELPRGSVAETALGDWITDCERSWSGADLALQNSLGVRAEMSKGPVTRRDIFNIMPFDNFMTNLVLKGALVRDYLDQGVDRSKGVIQVSGVSFDYDRDAGSGKRLRDVKIGGKPLDPAASYKVSTIDYLVRSENSALSRAEKTEFTRTLLRDIMEECARKQGLIVPPPAGRMTPVGEKH